MTEVIDCAEIKKRLSLAEPCCDSCHDDDDAGLSYLCGVHFPDGTEGEACCAVANKAAERIAKRTFDEGEVK